MGIALKSESLKSAINCYNEEILKLIGVRVNIMTTVNVEMSWLAVQPDRKVRTFRKHVLFMEIDGAASEPMAIE
jgi:hypothetical protein